MRGVGSGGGLPPPLTAQDPGICAFQEDPAGSLKTPPPYQNVFYKLFQAPKHHNKLSLKLGTTINGLQFKLSRWHNVTKTLMIHYSRTLTSQEHYDDRLCARPMLSLDESFV